MRKVVISKNPNTRDKVNRVSAVVFYLITWVFILVALYGLYSDQMTVKSIFAYFLLIFGSFMLSWKFDSKCRR